MIWFAYDGGGWSASYCDYLISSEIAHDTHLKVSPQMQTMTTLSPVK
jgi:hypothetical protein